MINVTTVKEWIILNIWNKGYLDGPVPEYYLPSTVSCYCHFTATAASKGVPTRNKANQTVISDRSHSLLAVT